MYVSSLELTNFKKHRSATFLFEQGQVIIQGDNYKGKTSILQAIFLGLFGSTAIAAPVKTLISDGAKDFRVTLTLSGEGGVVIERTSKDSSITRSGESDPYARGHTAVNKAVAELLDIDRGTFMKVYASEQGSPQQLLAMEGAELQKFIESVGGLDKLDEIQRAANKELNELTAKIQALQPFLLSPEELTQGLARKELLLKSMSENRQTLEHKNAEWADVFALKKQTEDSLASTRVQNDKANAWLAERSALDARLEELPYAPVADTKGAEARLDAARNRKDLATEAHGNALAINQALKGFEATDSRLKQELGSLGTVTLVPKEKITWLQDECYLATSWLGEQKSLKKDHLTLAGKLQALEAKRAQAEADLVRLPLLLIADTSHLEDRLAKASLAFESANAKARELSLSLHDATCPTCHRPFDLAFPKEKMEADLAALEFLIEPLLNTVEGVKLQLETVNKNNSLAVSRNNLAAHARVALENATSALNTVKDELAALPIPATEEQVKDKEASYSLKSEELSAAVKANAKAEVLLERQNKLLAEQASLMRPEGEIVDMALLNAEYDEASLEYTTAARDLASLQAANGQAQGINGRRQAVLDRLKAYPDSERPTLVPIGGMEADLDRFGHTLEALMRTINERNQEITDAKLALQPLQSKLDTHSETEDRCADYNSLASDSKFVATLVANSRAGFLADAHATLFGVASDFAKMVTCGDMEEVLVHEGSISYKENGVIRPKTCASGAQKSIIGLGMKLGVSNLITSEFETLLLDEVSSDMSPDISAACMSSLANMFPNSITVTHRAMDTAGQVIRL